MFSIPASNHIPLLFVILVNIKRLINSVIQEKKNLKTPPGSPRSRKENITHSPPSPITSRSSNSPRLPGSPKFLRRSLTDKIVSSTSPKTHEKLSDSSTTLNSNGENRENQKLQTHNKSLKPSIQIIQALFSSLLSWNISKDLDELHSKFFNLSRTAPQITFGTRGYYRKSDLPFISLYSS